eukprot:2969499-Lingulodinium_polyedra.AAC.1
MIGLRSARVSGFWGLGIRTVALALLHQMNVNPAAPSISTDLSETCLRMGCYCGLRYFCSTAIPTDTLPVG